MLALTSPHDTPYHRLPAGAKLAALCLFTIGLFWITDWRIMALVAGGVAGFTALPGLPFAGHAARMLWPLWPFAALLSVWHGWTGDWAAGAVILLRMVAAVAAANLVTMTTRLADMIAVIEGLARPLSPFLPPRRIAIAMALVIRFIPVLSARRAEIAMAWRARSARRAGWRTLPALTLAALEEADHVAEALRARGGAD